MSHEIEKRKIRFNGKIVDAEVYVLDGTPIEVFIDALDAPLDARWVEFVIDASDNPQNL